MTTRHLVDPELVLMLDTFPELTLTAETLPLVRTSLKEMMAQTPVDLPTFQTWRTDQFRVRGKEILEADKGRFPVRQCAKTCLNGRRWGKGTDRAIRLLSF
jgi:hypothetical protein